MPCLYLAISAAAVAVTFSPLCCLHSVLDSMCFPLPNTNKYKVLGESLSKRMHAKAHVQHRKAHNTLRAEQAHDVCVCAPGAWTRTVYFSLHFRFECYCCWCRCSRELVWCYTKKMQNKIQYIQKSNFTNEKNESTFRLLNCADINIVWWIWIFCWIRPCVVRPNLNINSSCIWYAWVFCIHI